MKGILILVLLIAACAESPRTDAAQSNLCTAQDQAAGLCAPFSLAGAKAASKRFANESYPVNLGVIVSCVNGGGYWACDITINLGGLLVTAGCTLWSDGNLECGIE